MSSYQPTYIGEIELNEETLAHYGVKGMKWRRRKARLKGKALELRAKVNRRLRGMSADEISDENGKFSFHRHDDGRARSTSNPRGNRRYNGKLEIDNRGYSIRSIDSNFGDRTGRSVGATKDIAMDNWRRLKDGGYEYKSHYQYKKKR